MFCEMITGFRSAKANAGRNGQLTQRPVHDTKYSSIVRNDQPFKSHVGCHWFPPIFASIRRVPIV